MLLLPVQHCGQQRELPPVWPEPYQRFPLTIRLVYLCTFFYKKKDPPLKKANPPCPPFFKVGNVGLPLVVGSNLIPAY